MGRATDDILVFFGGIRYLGVQFKLQMLAKTMVVDPLKIGYNTYKYGYIST
jgi:hypothetical protein